MIVLWLLYGFIYFIVSVFEGLKLNEGPLRQKSLKSGRFCGDFFWPEIWTKEKCKNLWGKYPGFRPQLHENAQKTMLFPGGFLNELERISRDFWKNLAGFMDESCGIFSLKKSKNLFLPFFISSILPLLYTLFYFSTTFLPS